MPLSFHSARYKLQCCTATKAAWLKNPHYPNVQFENLYDSYVDNESVPYDMKNRFETDICNFIVEYLIKCYDSWLLHNIMSLSEIDRLIENQYIESVYVRLKSMINIWNLTHKGPVPLLKEINTSQSVHALPVVKKTNNGLAILLKVEVPVGQKTLSEIKKAWTDKDALLVHAVISDMKEWGSRKLVMSKNENIYRLVLRGLWSKISSVSSHEYKKELIQRLWEECYEAFNLCADGHVSRLVNVMVGFDDEFNITENPMEQFQNNIALIANSQLPQQFKIEQVVKLMDDINMDPGERAAWLEAL